MKEELNLKSSIFTKCNGVSTYIVSFIHLFFVLAEMGLIGRDSLNFSGLHLK